MRIWVSNIRLSELLAQCVLGRFARQAFMSIHALLESLVVGRDPSSLICDRKIRPVSSKFLSSVLGPERDSKESRYWSQFPAYIWQPQRIKVRSVIGNGSDSFGWKIHDWIAVGTQFTVARMVERKGRLSCRHTGVTLIFRPWVKENMLTICKDHGVETEQRFRGFVGGLPDKSWAKLIAALLRSRSQYTISDWWINLQQNKNLNYNTENKQIFNWENSFRDIPLINQLFSKINNLISDNLIKILTKLILINHFTRG